MSKQDPNDLGYYHNKREEDRADGKGYNPPKNELIFVFDRRPADQAQRDAYDQGWDNAEEQANDRSDD